MQVFQTFESLAHLTAGIVDVVKRALGSGERVLAKLGHLAGVPLVEQPVKDLEHLVDPTQVAVHLAIRNEVVVSEGLVDERPQYDGVHLRSARRARRHQQQPSCQHVVLVRMVDQQFGECRGRRRLQKLARVVERGPGRAVVA